MGTVATAMQKQKVCQYCPVVTLDDYTVVVLKFFICNSSQVKSNFISDIKIHNDT